MRVPWVSALLDNVEVERCWLQAGTRGKLAHELAVDLLPGCLVGELGQRRRRLAPRELFLRDQHVHLPFVEIDAHPIPGPKVRQAAADCGLRRGVEDGWARRR